MGGRLLFVLSFILIIFFLPDSSSSLATSTFKNEQLYNEIKIYGEQHNIAPIDARIDPIWKAIPGYNGLLINIETSYRRMEKKGTFDSKKLVYEEIAPRVHMEDLDPEPIYRGNPEKPIVSFLINVAWGNEFIPTILNVLRDNGVRATFFLDGSWVSENAYIAKSIKQAGHEIGNHAYSHPDLNKRSEAETRNELQKTNDIIKETLQITPKWFAPPSGSFNKTTIQVAHELDMQTILWTADTVDWKNPKTSEMVQRVVSKTENGTMILMHPTKPVAEGLQTMITEIQKQGYELGTVSELIEEARIQTIDKGFFME